MSLTLDYKSAVSSKNLLLVRIMLKDSLLVDKYFIQFTEMIKYAEEMGMDIWTSETGELEKKPIEEWSIELMNLELTRLVNDFTKERVDYCKKIIRKVYGIFSCSGSSDVYSISGCTTNSSQKYLSTQHFQSLDAKSVNPNERDYQIIIKNAREIEKILRNRKSEKGDRDWYYKDIDKISKAAKRVSEACEQIKLRRK